MPASGVLFVLCLAFGLLQDPATAQEAVDPDLRAAVERFFATQQAEDLDAYLALWSATARRPRPEMLKYIFDAGDDLFSDIRLVRVMPLGDRVRVRAAATRERTERPRIAGAPAVTRRVQMDVSLTYLREGSEWKLLREGPASDDLAAALIEARTAEERTRLIEAEPELLKEPLILAIGRRAGEAAQMQLYPAAQAGYELMLEVARRAGHRKYEAEALQNLGNAFYYQRNLPAALQAYEQRLAIERERDDSEGVAAALGGIATVRYAFAEYAAALSAYQEALAIQERLEDESGAATTLVSTGNVLYLQGDFEGAIRDYARSRALYHKTANPAGEARALEGLGRVYLARGDYAGAIEAFTGVLEEGRARNDRIVQGNATLNLGDAHFRLGNLDVARRTFEESRAHFEAARDAANVGRVWQAVALTDLVAGRFPLAEDEYKKSSAACTGAGDEECVAGAAVGLGFAQTAQDRFGEAITSYRKAIDKYTTLKRREQAARAQIGLSQALSGNGDQKPALAAAAEARHAAVALENEDVLWRALVAESRALRELGDRDTALTAARAAVAALDRHVENARTRPADPVPRDSSAVFATLAILQAEGGDSAAAFETIERMRVHDLRISLARAEREIARGMTAAERDEERAIAVELVSLHAQLAREKDLPRPDAGRLARLTRGIEDATARRNAQESRLFERLPDLRIWRGLMPAATRTDVEGLLSAPGSTLLEFVVDDQDLLLLSVARRESGLEFAAHVLEVSRKSLADRVARLVQPDTLKDRAAWRKASVELMQLFPPAVRDSLAASSQVTVVPHEILWRVPFEALPLDEGYLADSVVVHYAHSVSVTTRVPQRAEAAGPDRAPLLIAAAPELHESVRSRVAQIAPGWALRSRERSMEEARAIAGVAGERPVMLLTGTDVTEAALRTRLPEAGVIHLALPFRINGGSALFSPILLAGEPPGDDAAADSGNDASIDPREIMNLSLPAGVAILSDDAAIAARDAADDATLVQWAWRAAGVPALVLPRWGTEPGSPDDRLLSDFHARLGRGEPADKALSGAQRAIRDTPERAAPYYWAGWLLITCR